MILAFILDNQLDNAKTANSILPEISLKSFCPRDRGRLGNEGQSILLKIGTKSGHVDLCDMPKF